MKTFSAAALLVFAVLVLAGCETVKGVGRDIVNTSDGVQRMMTRHQ